MYAFKFVSGNNYLIILADTYDEAVEKAKSIGLPGFKISNFDLVSVIENESDIVWEMDGVL